MDERKVSTDMLASGKLDLNSFTAGIKRSRSSDSGINSALGRVDTAPISKIEAPASKCIFARSMIPLSVLYFPPSKKESGVTLMTPIT